MSRIVVLMGVSGSGKTTVASSLARSLDCTEYIEGDSYHPPANVEKMRSAIPLTDDDRKPWLLTINALMRATTAPWTVVTCSALKRSYRQWLSEGLTGRIVFVFLKVAPATLHGRLAVRQHEYMPASLLDSQLATLEPPSVEEAAVTIQVDTDIEDTVQKVVAAVSQYFETETRA